MGTINNALYCGNTSFLSTKKDFMKGKVLNFEFGSLKFVRIVYRRHLDPAVSPFYHRNLYNLFFQS